MSPSGYDGLVFARMVQTDDSPTAEETAEEISQSADTLWTGFVDALPRAGVALAIIVVGWLLSLALRRGLAWFFARHRSPSYARVMSKIASWIFLGFVVAAALAITFPSVRPVDLLAGLGFFSVAVGFAFQDILENTLSGVLLLFRQPFESGDQIEVNGNEGTVEAITIRETQIRRYDGQLLVVPNRDVYKNAIRVQTSRAKRWISFTVGVAYEADADEVLGVVAEAVRDELGAEAEPRALVTRLAASTVDIEVLAKAPSSSLDARLALDAAIRAVKRRLDAEGIEMPSDILALQATTSFRSALHDRPVRPGGSDPGPDDAVPAPTG